MQSTTFLSRRSFGFTLIEIIVVLILLSILSVTAINRLTIDKNQWINPDIFASHLRYSQSRAMATSEPWGIKSQEKDYSMFKIHEGKEQTVPLPGGSIASKTVPRGVWWFDEMGRPYYSNSEYNEQAKPVTKDIKIDVSGKTLIITANTGYIQ